MSTIVAEQRIEDRIIEKFEAQKLHITNEPEFLKAFREKGIQTFKGLGIPSTKNEAWKYTNISKELKKGFEALADNTNLTSVSKFEIKGLDSFKIVLINGVFAPEFSELEEKESIIVTDLKTAISKYPELVEQHLGKYTDNENSSFIAQNNALFTNGYFIYLKKNIQLEKPIHVININTASKKFYANRNIIIAEQSSEVEVIDTFHSSSENASFCNTLTEVFVAENAKVHYEILQNKNFEETHIGNTVVNQKANSNFSTNNLNFGGGFVRNDLRILLNGESCDTTLYGLYLTQKNQLVDNHTLVDNIQPHCLSNELYKGVLKDHSTGVFNGKVFVRQAAQKTNAYQSNKNIILGDNAVINAKPELEIYADDVKCSHGCTTGQMDEQALFYLKARGIGEDKAKALLLNAFTKDVIENIKSDAFKKYINKLKRQFFYP